MSGDKNNLDGTVSKTYVDAQSESIQELIKAGVFEVATEEEIGKGVVAESTSKTTSVFGFAKADITHSYHPHHDAIRIRVLEDMVAKLLRAIERLPDVSLDVVKIRYDFDEWRDELKYSKVVDRPYVTSYEINYNSLPYQLNVTGLSSKPPTSE